MFECVDLSHRSFAMSEISNSFNINQLKVSDDELKTAVNNLSHIYDEFGKKTVLEEVKRFRQYIHDANMTDD